MLSVLNGLQKAKDAVTNHPWVTSTIGVGAATATFAPGALTAAATLAAANPIGLAVLGTVGAAGWAARRYLPGAREATTTMLHATPAIALVEIGNSIRSLSDGHSISPQERRALVETLNDFQTITGITPTADIQTKITALVEELESLESLDDAPDLLVISDECQEAIRALRPDLEELLTSNRGAIPQVLHRFHEFLGSMMEEATPDLRLGYAALNELLSQSNPTPEQFAQARSRFTRASHHIYASLSNEPPAIQAARALLEDPTLAHPLTEAQREILRAGLTHLGTTITAQSGEVERLLDKLTYHMFGEASGLIPKTRAELGDLLRNAPSPLLNAARLLDRFRSGLQNREEVIAALSLLENPTAEMTQFIEGGPLAPALLRTISTELDTRIQARQGLIWGQMSALREELLSPDRGMIKDVLDQFVHYLRAAPSSLRQARDALILLQGNPHDPALITGVRTTLEALDAPVNPVITRLLAETPMTAASIQAARNALQTVIEGEQGEVQNLLDGLFNSLNLQMTHLMHSVGNATRRAPEPLYQAELSFQLLLDALDRNAPMTALSPLIEAAKAHAIAPLSTALASFQEGRITREPLKTALQRSIETLNEQITAQSGSLAQAIRGASHSAQHEIDSITKRTSQAVTAQVNAWIRAGRRLIESAPDHPVKGLFERILDTHTSGGSALNATIYAELGRVDVLIPGFRENVLRGIRKEKLATDPELLLQNCFRVMQELVSSCPIEQQNAFYGSIYETARREDPLNPDIRGADWGREHAFSIESPALTFYGFAEWHKKMHHFTAQPLYRLRQTMLSMRESHLSKGEQNRQILEALALVPIDGFRDLILSKIYTHFAPQGNVASNWAESHLADDIGVTLELTWQAIKETVEALTPQESAFFYQCVSEVAARDPLETNGEAWARSHAFDEDDKLRAFAGFSWFMVKRAGGVTDVGHAVPPGIVGAQLGVGGGITSHPIFGNILRVLTKVPAIGLGGVTSYIERLFQDWLSPAVNSASHGTTAEQKQEIQGVIAQAIERLRQAHEIGSLPGYISALKGAFGTLSKYPLLINGLQVNLGSSSRMPSSYEKETALLQELEGLDSVEEEQDDSPAKWRAEVDAERRSLEQNARFMVLYKVFYEEPRFGVGDPNPRVSLDAQIQAQITARPGTSEYDAERERLREELGYYTTVTNNHFHTVMERVRAFPEEQRESAFRGILFEEVAKKSKIKAFFNRMFCWMLNGILRSIIGPYLSNMITEVRQGVRGLEEDQGKAHPIPAAPMNQLTSGMIAIKEAYKEWSLDTRGQHRDGRVKTLLDDPKYNQNMTPKSIHDETAKTLINYFIPTSPWDLKRSFFKVCSFCNKEELPNYPVLSKSLIVCKWIPGVFLAILAPLADTVKSIGSSLWTVTKRWLFEKTVIRLDVIPTLVETAKTSLYDSSAYQLALNELLCSQLEEIWKIMDPSKPGESETSKKYLAIAEQQPASTKQAIRALVENLFGAMQLRDLHTPEAMKAATTGKGSIAARAREQLNSLFLPDVVDNVVKLIMVGYQSVIQKDQMEKQLAQLMKTLNGAMVGASNDHQNFSAENIRQRNHALSRSIDHYKDLILSQAIKEAVDDYLTNPEKKQIDAAVLRFEKTKALMVGEVKPNQPTPFIPAFREAISECQTDPSTANVNRARELLKTTLHELGNSSRILEADIQQGKISQATANHLQEGRMAIITELEHLSHDFSAAFQANLSLTEAQFIVPRMRQISTTLRNIIDDPAATDLQTKVNNASTWIQELKTHKPLSRHLMGIVRSFEGTLQLAQEMADLVSSQSATVEATRQIRLMTDALVAQKQAAASRQTALARNTHDGVAQAYRSLEALIKTLPESVDRQRLQDTASNLWRGDTANTVAYQRQITTYIDRIVSARQTSIQTKIASIQDNLAGYQADVDTFIATQDGQTDDHTQAREQHIADCLGRLNDLEATVTELTPPPFIATNLHDLSSDSSVNRWICNMIFQELRQRSGQFLGMVSDPIVFQQMIRQGMLFVLEQMKTPQEFAELTKKPS